MTSKRRHDSRKVSTIPGLGQKPVGVVGEPLRVRGSCLIRHPTSHTLHFNPTSLWSVKSRQAHISCSSLSSWMRNFVQRAGALHYLDTRRWVRVECHAMFHPGTSRSQLHMYSCASISILEYCSRARYLLAKMSTALRSTDVFHT